MFPLALHWRHDLQSVTTQQTIDQTSIKVLITNLLQKGTLTVDMIPVANRPLQHVAQIHH